MKRAKRKSPKLVARRNANLIGSKANRTTPNSVCDHTWEPDGQTMTAVRWICIKCGKTEMSGLDI